METKQKFKLTNAVQQGLLARSKRLPNVTKVNSSGIPITRIVQVPGDRLTQADLKPGQVLNRNHVYRVNQFILVDHFKTMCELYLENGPDAVKDYEDATLSLERYTNTKMKLSWVELAKNWLKYMFSSTI